MSEWIYSCERTPEPCEMVLGFDGRCRIIVQWIGHAKPETPWNMTDMFRYSPEEINQPLEGIPMWAHLPPHPLDSLMTVKAQIDEP
jgi:hypothetical protein